MHLVTKPKPAYAISIYWTKPVDVLFWDLAPQGVFEPRCEKTGLRGFRPGPTQTRLYNHRRWLEA